MELFEASWGVVEDLWSLGVDIFGGGLDLISWVAAGVGVVCSVMVWCWGLPAEAVSSGGCA